MKSSLFNAQFHKRANRAAAAALGTGLLAVATAVLALLHAATLAQEAQVVVADAGRWHAGDTYVVRLNRYFLSLLYSNTHRCPFRILHTGH